MSTVRGLFILNHGVNWISCFLLQGHTCFLVTIVCEDPSSQTQTSAIPWSSTHHQTLTLQHWEARPFRMTTPPLTLPSLTATTLLIHMEITEGQRLIPPVEGHCFHHLHYQHYYQLCLESLRHTCSWYSHFLQLILFGSLMYKCVHDKEKHKFYSFR